MSNNSSFRKDIIQQSAKLTSKNLDIMRLNNVTLTREIKKDKPTPDKAKKKVAENNARQLQRKYKQTTEDPQSRKLFIKQIGRVTRRGPQRLIRRVRAQKVRHPHFLAKAHGPLGPIRRLRHCRVRRRDGRD